MRGVQLGQRDFFYATCLWSQAMCFHFWKAVGTVFSERLKSRLPTQNVCLPNLLFRCYVVSKPPFISVLQLLNLPYQQVSNTSWAHLFSTSVQLSSKLSAFLRQRKGLVKVRWRPCGLWGKCSTWPCYSQSIHMVHQQMGWLRSDTVSLTHTDLGKWLAGTSQVTPVSFLPLQPPFLFFESNSVRTLTSQLKLEVLASADNFALLQGLELSPWPNAFCCLRVLWLLPPKASFLSLSKPLLGPASLTEGFFSTLVTTSLSPSSIMSFLLKDLGAGG